MDEIILRFGGGFAAAETQNTASLIKSFLKYKPAPLKFSPPKIRVRNYPAFYYLCKLQDS